jgi:hypothetical protein
MARADQNFPARREPMTAKQPDTADYAEAMKILTALARKGDVRAAIALAGHLRKHEGRDPIQARIDELAARRRERSA